MGETALDGAEVAVEVTDGMGIDLIEVGVDLVVGALESLGDLFS
ncbi:hypothetical protein [Archangium sp.]